MCASVNALSGTDGLGTVDERIGKSMRLKGETEGVDPVVERNRRVFYLEEQMGE